MSYYYTFYVGAKYKLEDGSTTIGIHPGCQYNGKPLSVMSISRSFFDESLLDRFHTVNENDFDANLKSAFTYDGKFDDNLHMISKKELMNLNSNYLKSGYFLRDDVEAYEKWLTADNGYALCDTDVFYDKLSPVVYADMQSKDVKTEERRDDEGYPYTVHGWQDYMYYVYPDNTSKEAYTHSLQEFARCYDEMLFDIPGWYDAEPIIICQEG